ncbi:unnamed protein product [Leptosia nina]|uniref:Uncharacterized protein n=1 Tax=Leptosia nina TaxID=320188 RepID=A0AAV1K5N7_9NEOP
MQKDDFKSTKCLESNITNRKLSVERSKVEWLKIQWILYNKMHPLSMYYKYSNNQDALFTEVIFSKRTSRDPSNFELEVLYPNGKKNNTEKKKDPLCLLEHAPPAYHPFYHALRDSNNEENNLDGDLSDSTFE